MNILILDDDPDGYRLFAFRKNFETLGQRNGKKYNIKHVVDAADCISELPNTWDAIFLDHDLGGEHYVDPSAENCGTRVVNYIVEHPECCDKTELIVVHSLNFYAGKSMTLSLSEALKNTKVLHVPGVFLEKRFFELLQ